MHWDLKDLITSQVTMKPKHLLLDETCWTLHAQNVYTSMS
jgi:hypothetical protein